MRRRESSRCSAVRLRGLSRRGRNRASGCAGSAYCALRRRIRRSLIRYFGDFKRLVMLTEKMLPSSTEMPREITSGFQRQSMNW